MIKVYKTIRLVGVLTPAQVVFDVDRVRRKNGKQRLIDRGVQRMRNKEINNQNHGIVGHPQQHTSQDRRSSLLGGASDRVLHRRAAIKKANVSKANNKKGKKSNTKSPKTKTKAPSKNGEKGKRSETVAPIGAPTHAPTTANPTVFQPRSIQLFSRRHPVQ